MDLHAADHLARVCSVYLITYGDIGERDVALVHQILVCQVHVTAERTLGVNVDIKVESPMP